MCIKHYVKGMEITTGIQTNKCGKENKATKVDRSD